MSGQPANIWNTSQQGIKSLSYVKDFLPSKDKVCYTQIRKSNKITLVDLCGNCVIGYYIAIVGKENPLKIFGAKYLHKKSNFSETKGTLAISILTIILLIKFCLGERKGKRKLERPRSEIKAYFLSRHLFCSFDILCFLPGQWRIRGGARIRAHSRCNFFQFHEFFGNIFAK